MKQLSRYLRSLLVAVVALALSASLAFGARQPTSASGTFSGGAVVLGEDDEAAGEESGEVTEESDTEGDEDAAEDEAAGEDGDNCATDPTLLTEEELDELRHGSIVCWAAHQTEWPEWFSNHGQFVKCWAHHGKADAPSCTEDPNAEEPTTEESAGEEPAAATRVHGNGHGNGKAKGKNKPQD